MSEDKSVLRDLRRVTLKARKNDQAAILISEIMDICVGKAVKGGISVTIRLNESVSQYNIETICLALKASGLHVTNDTLSVITIDWS